MIGSVVTLEDYFRLTQNVVNNFSRDVNPLYLEHVILLKTITIRSRLFGVSLRK